MLTEPLIINACLTGMVPTKKESRFIPLQPAEIIDDARSVIEAGATMIHLHARDSQGFPTYKKDVYERIIPAIRKINKDVVICVTTSGRKFGEFSQRSEVLELMGEAKPDFASLSLGSMNFPKTAVSNSPEMIVALAQKMKEKEIQPEWEIFEVGMLNYGKYLVKHGVLDQPKWMNFFLGNLGTAPASIEMLAFFLSLIPDSWRWAATGVGRYQLGVNKMALEKKGHIRVGMEDSWFMDEEKTILATNRLLVERIVTVAKENGRTIASPSEARRLLLG